MYFNQLFQNRSYRHHKTNEINGNALDLLKKLPLFNLFLPLELI